MWHRAAMRADRKLLAGVFLACFANLLLEVMIYGGFTATLLVGAAGYLAAGLLGRRVASAHAAATEASPAA